jgi:hypothetical protein
MINMASIPQDCSAETLFKDAARLIQTEPFGYALQYMGSLGYLKVPVWGIKLDPLEYNTRRKDGTIDHDNYICLCKWLDGSPITFRYRTTEVYPIREE